MDNQHRKIVGYRELSQEDIDLMNRIKAKGSELLALHDELQERISAQLAKAWPGGDCPVFPMGPVEEDDEAFAEYNRIDAAEPFRWAAIGKTDIQTGVMALVRAVAQPTDV